MINDLIHSGRLRGKPTLLSTSKLAMPDEMAAPMEPHTQLDCHSQVNLGRQLSWPITHTGTLSERERERGKID